jgi:hypothetical protein
VPDFRIIPGIGSGIRLLSDFATILHGQNAGDNSCFNRYSWEVPAFGRTWMPYQLAPAEPIEFSGRSQIVRWEEENGMMALLAESVRHLNHKAQQWRSGKPNWGKKGVAVSLIGRIIGTLYKGDIYGVSCGVIIPKDERNLGAIWQFVRSGEFEARLREVDPSLAVSVKTVLAVPFEYEMWADRYLSNYPNGLPKAYSDDPTQWLFHGHPCGSVLGGEEQEWTNIDRLRNDITVLQVAVARLLGYCWPPELDANMELSDEARTWVKKSEALLSLADDDGIVCIPPVRGEGAAADRLLNLLAASYGDAWSNDTLAQLLKHADHSGKTLESWLREKFFAQHCKLFQHRPFVWHIWDGLRDGFAALVNYHKLDYKTLETLIYTYLGDWIRTQKDAIAKGTDGAAEKLAAAEALKKRLELILEGEAPYDIFVRWKPLEKQPIGWNPDLNDGVRINIRPFMTAGVLRFNKKPQLNISWDKDRGKDVESAPWYHLFNGDRINDHHLSLAEKRAAEKIARAG